MTSPPAGYLVRVEWKHSTDLYSQYCFALDVTPASAPKGERLLFATATGRLHQVAGRTMRRQAIPKPYEPKRLARNLARREREWDRAGARYSRAALEAVQAVLRQQSK